MSLHLAQSRRDLARELVVDRLSSVFGLLAASLVAALVAFLTSAAVDPEWSTPVRAIATVASAVGALGAVALVFYLAALERAPVIQRDDARTRLREIKDASRTYSIEPVEVTTVPDGPSAMVRLVVRNNGRGGQFAAILEGLGGTEDPLMDPYSYVCWPGGVIAEEIGPGEHRQLSVALIVPEPGGGGLDSERLAVSRLGAQNDRVGRSYELRPGVTVLKLRISARGVPALGYSRTITIQLRWDGPGSEMYVQLGPTSPGDEQFSPAFEHLLDF